MPASPVTYPLGPPSISGTTITVDQALANPTVITRDIARIADQQLVASRLFSDAGGVNGGAVLYELPPSTATDLYAERALQEVEPGAEFPQLTFLRGVPVVAKPKKIGGKIPFTKEARKRNDNRLIMRAMAQTANTLALTLDAMALAVLNASISGNSRTLAGQSWSTAAGVTNLNVSGTNQPSADILAAKQTVELELRGANLNGIVMHPNQELSLGQITERIGTSIKAYLANVGIDTVLVSRTVTAGSPILFEIGQVGGWANEFPLAEETWYEPEEQTSYYQISQSPVMFCDNPYAVLQVTGTA